MPRSSRFMFSSISRIYSSGSLLLALEVISRQQPPTRIPSSTRSLPLDRRPQTPSSARIVLIMDYLVSSDFQLHATGRQEHRSWALVEVQPPPVARIYPYLSHTRYEISSDPFLSGALPVV